MNTRTQHALAIWLLAAFALAGCSRNIVRASSPSVATPPPIGRPSASPGAEAAAAPPVAPPELPPPEPSEPPAIIAGPVPAEPAAPRPRPAAPASQPAQPEPAQPKFDPPQISALLKPSDQQRLERLTTEQITIAERNVQQANNRRLTPVQKDLVDKINGFLSQAHEAIQAKDWVRAQNLAEKAQILSIELTKSL